MTGFARLEAALADRYRLERELGQGGMATVYLAQDLRHDRQVALKVLRPELAAVIGAERFLQEIKTTANLQHPHILPLFDSGKVDGTVFYVMPFVEGESLRDRLAREKQLPVDDAVRITREVASALDYAHRHGIIHRDIKPENILLHDGQALVADFGIALAASSAGGSRMTETGMSLGTPHYMSPEQAMGEREITPRSDVYALGCVAYEMLTGESPFTGPTAQAIVAKVLTDDPRPPRELRRSVPPHVEDAVLTALEKLPADRFASAAEFAAALAEGAKAEGRKGTKWSRAHPAAQPPNRLAALLGVLGVLAAAAFFIGRATGRSATPVSPPSRLAILAPGIGGGGGFTSLGRQLALTPNGQAVVFLSFGNAGVNQFLLQRLDAVEPTLIQGGAGVSNPHISRDGRWLIGSRPGAAVRLSLEGGQPSPLPEVVATPYGSWGEDGSFWFSVLPGGLRRLVAGDSIVEMFPGRLEHLLLQQVLDGDRVALMLQIPVGTSSGQAFLVDLRSGDTTSVVNVPVSEIRYTAGLLVYLLPNGTLFAAPLDLKGRRLTGPPTQIASEVSLTGSAIGQLAVATNGTVAYIPEAPRSLVFLDRAGASRPAIDARLNYHAPKFSPDGRRLTLDYTEPDGRDVWILSLDQGTLSRATFVRDGHDATWTPDGRFITYASFKSGALGLYRIRPGSTEPAESLFASTALGYSGVWLPDGSGLITTGTALRPGSRLDIGWLRNGGRGPLDPLVASSFQEQYPAVSPDGKWLAFVSDQSGQQQVYVRHLEREEEQVQVSQEGGNEPVWGPDGREVFYRGTVGQDVSLMVAGLRNQPALEVTSRRALFPVGEMVGSNPHANYDISPDGKTFVMVRRSPATRIMVIQNLPELVRRIRGTDAGAR